MLKDREAGAAVTGIVRGRWAQLAHTSPAAGFVDACLRGGSQIMFQNNALTGLLFLLAIAWGAYAEGQPAIAVGAILAALLSTATAYVLPMDRPSRRAGLYGYNGILLGIALPVFLAPTPAMWGCLALGAIVSTIAMAALTEYLKGWKIAALTAPFVLTTWLVLLAAYAFSGLQPTALPAPHAPVAPALAVLGEPTVAAILIGALNGIAQVFLLPSAVSGALILAGLLVSSRGAAAFAVLGSLLAMLAAGLLGADEAAIHAGLYSFSAVLTAIALGDTFNRPGWRVLGYAVAGVLFTVVVQGALNSALAPIGIPTLTMPFVLATWLFLLPNRDLMPPPTE